MARNYMHIGAAAAGAFPAILWFWSATIKVEFGHYGGMPPAERAKLALQSRLNAGAAALTGLTTLLSVF